MAAKKAPKRPAKPAKGAPRAKPTGAGPHARVSVVPTTVRAALPKTPEPVRARVESFDAAGKPLDKESEKQKRRRAGLRALVPTSYRAEGETNEFLAAYKTKWLSRFSFTSHASVESLLVLSFMVLALDREGEAERIVDNLIKHVDLRNATDPVRTAIAAALNLSAWLKGRRGVNAAPLIARARELTRQAAVNRDREWLSSEAVHELRDAVERRKTGYLVYPFEGILHWLNDPGARTKAEEVLRVGLECTRALMK